MIFKDAKNNSKWVEFTEGNKKLKSTKAVKFLIFNLPAIITCPFRTALCEKFCYARKAEKQYKKCLPFRMRNYNRTMGNDFIESVVYTLSIHAQRPSYQSAKKIIVRIHESGDFYDMGYFEKWVEIAKRMYAICPDMIFTAYTKSPFCIGYPLPDNFVVRYSIWSDTKAEYIDEVEKHNTPIYTAVEHFTNETENERCRCESCGTCLKCYSNKFNKLLCEIH